MITIQRVHHIGIRVSDRERAIAFYRHFGFEPFFEDADDPVVIARNDRGVELNFILNADDANQGRNVLMDEATKFAGYTHVALEVASIEDTVAALGELGIAITEGPVRLGPGVSLFVRDPDGTVIELRHDGEG